MDETGDEAAHQGRAHPGRRHEHDGVEEGIDEKIGEGLHTSIVSRPDIEFDGVAGCSRGGVFPTIATGGASVDSIAVSERSARGGVLRDGLGSLERGASRVGVVVAGGNAGEIEEVLTLCAAAPGGDHEEQARQDQQ